MLFRSGGSSGNPGLRPGGGSGRELPYRNCGLQSSVSPSSSVPALPGVCRAQNICPFFVSFLLENKKSGALVATVSGYRPRLICVYSVYQDCSIPIFGLSVWPSNSSYILLEAKKEAACSLVNLRPTSRLSFFSANPDQTSAL